MCILKLNKKTGATEQWLIFLIPSLDFLSFPSFFRRSFHSNPSCQVCIEIARGA
jgi:hypothetical protein